MCEFVNILSCFVVNVELTLMIATFSFAAKLTKKSCHLKHFRHILSKYVQFVHCIFEQLMQNSKKKLVVVYEIYENSIYKLCIHMKLLRNGKTCRKM